MKSYKVDCYAHLRSCPSDGKIVRRAFAVLQENSSSVFVTSRISDRTFLVSTEHRAHPQRVQSGNSKEDVKIYYTNIGHSE